MFKRTDLEQLAAFESTSPLVSLYLNMSPQLRGRGTPDAYRARLKNLMKEVNGRAPKADLKAIENYFEKEFDWVGRSVAIFSAQGDDYWQVERFAVPLRSSVHVANRPFIMPLANLIDTFGSHAVALVDQQTIRMFDIHLGEQVAQEQLAGEGVQRVKTDSGGAMGRSRGDHLQSHTDQQVRGNLKRFADALATFCKHHAVENILLGGSEHTVQQFKQALSPPLKNQVRGTLTLSVRAPEADVLEQSLEKMQHIEAQREKQLVEQLTTRVASGGAGVIGLDETLQAVEAGRVDTLVLVEGAIPPEQADPVIVRVLDFGGEVTFVDADSPLAEEGGIGALLRY